MRADSTHAIAFVNEVAAAAEAAVHRPDIVFGGNKVTLAHPATLRAG